MSPTIIQHRIHLHDDATPKRDPQYRLNPIMQEDVHNGIVKLLDNERIIYPIFNSQWISPVTLPVHRSLPVPSLKKGRGLW